MKELTNTDHIKEDKKSLIVGTTKVEKAIANGYRVVTRRNPDTGKIVDMYYYKSNI